MTIAIIDLGIGNINSVQKALKALGATGVVSGDPAQLQQADKYLLPGVGNFAAASQALQKNHFGAHLHSLVGEKPLLGICVGLQIFAQMGEEQGEHPGLGWIPGRVKPIPTALPLPHVGWNAVQQCQTSPLFHAIPKQSCFYFTHSYSLQGAPNQQVLAQTDYGGNLVAAIGIGRRYAVQFHPEKSQAVGLQLLRNFLELC